MHGVGVLVGGVQCKLMPVGYMGVLWRCVLVCKAGWVASTDYFQPAAQTDTRLKITLTHCVHLQTSVFLKFSTPEVQPDCKHGLFFSIFFSFLQLERLCNFFLFRSSTPLGLFHRSWHRLQICLVLRALNIKY